MRLLELELNPVPVKYGTKIPLRKKHHTAISKDEIKEYAFEEIGISTGYSSLNLQVLDFDTKNIQNPDEYMENFNCRIPSTLFEKLVIQKTPSGGFHYIFRCDEIESSKKLARNKRGEGVIETRGLNSYIKCYPSDGYEMIQKSFNDITIISTSEKRFLFTISKQLDELYLKDVYKRYSKDDIYTLKKFKDYNKNVDIGIELITKAGWTKHSENKDWINFTRPNSKSGDLHGGYNKEGFVFQTFSTAQDKFITGKGYNNHHLFCELEHDGNYKKGYAILYDKGYGNENDEKDEKDEEPDIFLEFLSNEIDENIYLDQLRKGEIPQGLSWGWSSLDSNFLLKRNSFNILLGLDNIGKSVLLSSMMVSTNLLHNIKWGISSPEARTATTRRDLIEAKLGKKLGELNKIEYNKAFKYSRDNFFIINNEKHWSIKDILNNGKILFEQYGIDVLLIDPFSFYTGSGKFTDDNEILSKIRVFSEKHCSVIVVDHPFTGFARIGKDESGYLRLPNKYEISGGNAKANRCDDFISAHRITNHPDYDIRKTMQISVQKVKDKSTGGEPHVEGEWSELIYETRDGFLGYWDSNGNNPMYKYMMSKLGVRAKLKR